MPLGCLLLALLAVQGCTLSAGDWFANLRATFAASYVAPADRDLGDGWQKLNTSYEAKMTNALVHVDTIALQELGGTGGAVAFYPANPPPGYSLCHSGHCHSDEGALVPYDQIAAELAGTGPSAITTVVALRVGETNLLAPDRRDLDCEPGCGIPYAQIVRARVTVTRFAFEGLIRPAPTSPSALEGEVPSPWKTTWNAQGAGQPPITLDLSIDLPADNAHARDVSLDVTLVTSARLLDDVDWAALTRGTDGTIDLSAAANEPAQKMMKENVGEAALAASIERCN